MSAIAPSSPGRIPVFSAPRIAELLAEAPAPPRHPTSEQRRVIEFPLAGRALVVAGAGSGKTETMANRVVWLVANGLVTPDAVLGLTFTRKAAGELAERIEVRLERCAQRLDDARSRGALSAEEAPRAAAFVAQLSEGLELPEVSTYHSFASSVVQEFGPLAGIAPGLRLIDEAVAWRLARETIVRSRDPELVDCPLSLGALVGHVLALGGAVSDHLSSLDRVDQVVEEFRRTGSLPYSERSATGTPAAAAPGKMYAPVRDAIAALAPTPLITRLARAYAAEKERRGLIEFSDQLRLAMLTLERAPAVAAALRDRFHTLLLDEVQDTSVGQTRLLARIFAGTSVMAVGDPHQSIYGWRGASAESLVSFHRDFRSVRADPPSAEQHAETLNLSISWRNPSTILDAANTIAAPLRAESPFDVRELRPRPGAPAGAIEVIFPETVRDERHALAEWMRDARASHLAETGRLPTAAVVFRRRAPMPGFAAALRELGIPCRIIGVGGLLGTPEVTDLVCALRCVWYADAGSELIRLLAGPRFGIGVSDLAGLRAAARWFAERDASHRRLSDEERAADGVLPDPDRRVTTLDALDEIAGMSNLDHAALRAVSEEGRNRLREAGRMLRRLRAALGGGVLELLRQAEQALRLDIELEAREGRGGPGGGAGDTAGSGARANLDLFAEVVEGFLAVDEHGSLPAVLEWLERAARSDEAAEHAPEPEPGTVQLITVHGAKGLEWDLVAVPRLVEREFPLPSTEGAGWLRTGRLPDELRGDRAARPGLQWRLAANQKELRDAIAAYRAELAERSDLEERRLAYVAVTRAASRLVLTGSFWGGHSAARGPSEFLRELARHELVPSLPERSEHAHDPEEATELTAVWPLDPLGSRSTAVWRAVRAVRAGRTDAVPARTPRPDGHPDPATSFGAPSSPPSIDPVVHLLIAERRAEQRETRATKPTEATEHAEYGARTERTERTEHADPLGARITASTFHEFIADPRAVERNRRRPLPQRPYRRTRIGNRFHEWVERRATTVRGTELPLIAAVPDESGLLAGSSAGLSAGLSAGEDAELAELIERFERSRWADRRPVAVELEVSLPFAGRRLVSKIDAVYRAGSGDEARFEVVDWKTGRAPRDDAERRARLFQLDLYRHAYAAWTGVAAEQIDACLFFVAEGAELRLDAPRSLAELEALWLAAAADAAADAATATGSSG